MTALQTRYVRAAAGIVDLDLLGRALQAGHRVRYLGQGVCVDDVWHEGDTWLVTSSNPAVRGPYAVEQLTDGWGCDCEARAHEKVCRHITLVIVVASVSGEVSG